MCFRCSYDALRHTMAMHMDESDNLPIKDKYKTNYILHTLCTLIADQKVRGTF